MGLQTRVNYLAQKFLVQHLCKQKQRAFVGYKYITFTCYKKKQEPLLATMCCEILYVVKKITCCEYMMTKLFLTLHVVSLSYQNHVYIS